MILRVPAGFAAITAALDGRGSRHRPPAGVGALHLVARAGLTTIGLAPDVADRAVAFDGEASGRRVASILGTGTRA